MTKFTKLYSQIVNNPKDVKFKELDKLLRYHGFMCRKSSGGSSHYNYYHLDLPDVLTVPYNRPVKAIYAKQAIKAIQQLKERGE